MFFGVFQDDFCLLDHLRRNLGENSSFAFPKPGNSAFSDLFGGRLSDWITRKHLGKEKKIVQQKTHDGSTKLDYLPIHEWLKFMVNVGKYPIHEASGKKTHPKKPGNSVFGDLFWESYGK